MYPTLAAASSTIHAEPYLDRLDDRCDDDVPKWRCRRSSRSKAARERRRTEKEVIVEEARAQETILWRSDGDGILSTTKRAPAGAGDAPSPTLWTEGSFRAWLLTRNLPDHPHARLAQLPSCT